MPKIAYTLLPLVGGGLFAAQAPINARLRLIVSSPVASAFVSFLIGTAILLVVTAAVGALPGAARGFGAGPWWAYLGGACGAVLVFSTLLASPRIGVTITFVAVTLGQVLVAAAIDRLGLFGVARVPLSWERLVAIGLLFVSLGLLYTSRR